MSSITGSASKLPSRHSCHPIKLPTAVANSTSTQAVRMAGSSRPDCSLSDCFVGDSCPNRLRVKTAAIAHRVPENRNRPRFCRATRQIDCAALTHARAAPAAIRICRRERCCRGAASCQTGTEMPDDPRGFFGMAAIRGRDITLWSVTVKSYRLPDAPYLAVHRTCDGSTDSAQHQAWCRKRRQASWRTRNERGIPSRQ